MLSDRLSLRKPRLRGFCIPLRRGIHLRRTSRPRKRHTSPGGRRLSAHVSARSTQWVVHRPFANRSWFAAARNMGAESEWAGFTGARANVVTSLGEPVRPRNDLCYQSAIVPVRATNCSGGHVKLRNGRLSELHFPFFAYAAHVTVTAAYN